MVLNHEKRDNKQLNLRKGWSVLISAVLIFSTLTLLTNVKPVNSAVDSYSEDFTTTTNMDPSNTNVSGWGSGNINLPWITLFNPTPLTGFYDTPGEARGVFVSGDYAYVADWGSGLQVVDISDPTHPSLAGSYDTPGNAQGVFVSGDYAYIADAGSGLQVVDISDPLNPINASAYDTPGYARGVFVSGDYAYVADHSFGLQIVDISDPANPINASVYDTPNHAWGVFVSGDYAYVADGNSGLQVVNISDPLNPSNASDTPNIIGVYDTPDYARWVFVSGDYAYVADRDSGLQVIEVVKDYFESVAVAQSLTVFSGSSSESLVSANLTCNDFIPSGCSITYYLSPDNGSHWEQVNPGSEHSFTNAGSQLKWKAVLTTSNPSKTPTISDLSISYETVTEEEEEGFPWLWVGVGIGVAAAAIGAIVSYFKYFKKE
ncbi:MAG: LVIVD repeat-containing protein [Candidatus Wukongarchaeota archaeon]|nr:hypothetical protein [Candidatus Wukongarchaeota archaeon]